MASRPKPPTAAWIQRERHRLGLKPGELVTRLSAQGVEVTEQTIRVWESNSDRRPSPYNLEALERVFGSTAPETAAGDMGDVAAAIDRQTEVIKELVAELRFARAIPDPADERMIEDWARARGYLPPEPDPEDPPAVVPSPAPRSRA